jgi:hypothetical protein
MIKVQLEFHSHAEKCLKIIRVLVALPDLSQHNAQVEESSVEHVRIQQGTAYHIFSFSDNK